MDKQAQALSVRSAWTAKQVQEIVSVKHKAACTTREIQQQALLWLTQTKNTGKIQGYSF